MLTPRTKLFEMDGAAWRFRALTIAEAEQFLIDLQAVTGEADAIALWRKLAALALSGVAGQPTLSEADIRTQLDVVGLNALCDAILAFSGIQLQPKGERRQESPPGEAPASERSPSSEAA